MSHTNSTTNYNLPQFIGTDKPTWLNDVNGAMSAIDTQMKANADSATSASTSATTANTAIGTLANLNTAEKTNLVGAINEVNTGLGTVSGVASNASAQATTADTKAGTALTELSDLLNFSYQSLTPTATNYTLDSASFITCAKNANGTLAKIYGRIRLGASNNSTDITIPDTGLRPESDITVTGCCLNLGKKSTGHQVFMQDYIIHQNGTVTLSTANSASAYPDGRDIILLANMLVIKDFGDTPTPE